MKNTILACLLVGTGTFLVTSTLPAAGGSSTVATLLPQRVRNIVWPITQEGTDLPVQWVDAPNARFAVNDSGTNWDDTDDVVLDKETGLIWQRSPQNGDSTWMDGCKAGYNHHYVYQNRKGWRLPTVEELTTLVKPYVDPALPPGHPFLNVLSESYWTSSTWYTYAPEVVTSISRTNYAYIVNLSNGAVHYEEKALTNPVWFVRGGVGQNGM